MLQAAALIYHRIITLGKKSFKIKQMLKVKINKKARQSRRVIKIEFFFVRLYQPKE
jgi:hypothetical protein